MSAVSARPLRAPCVEVKYSSTVSPSRKLAMIGVGMISPEGLAIRPRMPASWRICCVLPRAPESTIMKIGFRPAARPRPACSLRRSGCSSCWSSASSAPATCSVAWAQMSMTLLYFSPLVISPSAYWPSTSSTVLRAASTTSFLLAGICMSSIAIETPAAVA